METLFLTLLILHIAAGTVALVAGPASMINRKGGKLHRLTGKVFFYTMMLVAVTAVVMALLPNHRDPFLLIIGIFSAYLVSSGYRVLYLKGLVKGQRPQLLDWLITSTMAVFTVFFIFSGIVSLSKGSGNSDSIVSVVFGSIALYLVTRDLRKYVTRPTDKNFWLYDHIIRMIAGNIAAYTAFLVVNNTVLPPVVAWLLPTVIGTLVIAWNIRKYKMKAKASKSAQESAIVNINVSN